MPIPLRIFGRKRFRHGVIKTLHGLLVSLLVLQSVFVGGFAFSRQAQAAELPAAAVEVTPEAPSVPEVAPATPTPELTTIDHHDPCDDVSSITTGTTPAPCPEPCDDLSSSTVGTAPKPQDCPEPKKTTLTVVKTIGQTENIPGWSWMLDESSTALPMGFSTPKIVVPGTHTVHEIQQSGYMNIGWSCFQNVSEGPRPILGIGTGESFSVNVPDSGATCYFNNALIPSKNGSIHGTKTDTMGHPLSGWEICYEPSRPSTKGESPAEPTCTTTNANGYYEFTDVPFGTYDIRETMQAGWVAESPESGVYYYQELCSKDPVLERNFVNRELPTNITVTKTDSLTAALPGQSLTYTMIVSNTSNVTALHVTAVDTLPAHFAYGSSTVNGAAAAPMITGSSVTWHLGNLAAGASATITMTGTLDTSFAFGTTSITNTVVVHTETAESSTEDNTASDTDTVTTSSVLGLVKSGPSVITAGGNLSYTLHWSVTGTATVTHATITDPFPSNTTFVSQTCGTTTGTCVAMNDASHIVWDLGTRAQGEHGTVTVTLQSSAALADGVFITNTATFDSEETPAVQASVITTVHNTVQGTPLLSITKTNNIVSFTNPGKIVTYTVVVKNAAAATAAAMNVMVTDTLPEGFTFVDTGLATKTVAVGTIAPGNSVTLTYDVQISPIVSSGSYVNTATAKGDNTSTVSATSLVAIRVPEVLGATTEPTLTLEKTVNVTKPIASGSIISYTLKITNTGDADAANVSVTDVLPKGFTFLLDGTGTKIWNIGTLKPNHSRVIVFDVKISNSVINGSYKNVATLTATDLPKITATATVEVKNPRVLGLATTGAGTIEYAVLLLSALSLLVGASLMISNRHGYRTV